MPGKQTGDLKLGKGNFCSQVKKYQTETGFLIPHLPFSRLCREIVQNTTANNVQNIPAIEAVMRISPDAVLILQTEAENQVMKYLSSANYLAIYGKRSTLKIQDFQTLECILAVECYNRAPHHTQTGGIPYNYRDVPNRESQLRKGRKKNKN
ncbi:hypothetical protein BGX38DRAFT_1145583 [Terfezia claveryi]|nr:hypothetical protein BGX38DRAFT_1145583 [Terfezia claveryi]